MIKEKAKFWPIVSSKIGVTITSYIPLPAIYYTFASLLPAALALWYAYKKAYILAIILFLLANMMDVIDGAVARAQNNASNLGAFLDGTIDRFIDFAMIYSYFFFDIRVPFLDINQFILMASFLVIMPSFIVAYANHRGAVNDDNETLIWRLMNRAEMFVLMMTVCITSLFSATWAGYALILFIALSFLTTITNDSRNRLSCYKVRDHESLTPID